jgi:hypothetical protein
LRPGARRRWRPAGAGAIRDRAATSDVAASGEPRSLSSMAGPGGATCTRRIGTPARCIGAFGGGLKPDVKMGPRPQWPEPQGFRLQWRWVAPSWGPDAPGHRKAPTRTPPPPNPNDYCPMDHLLFGAGTTRRHPSLPLPSAAQASGSARGYGRASERPAHHVRQRSVCQWSTGSAARFR